VLRRDNALAALGHLSGRGIDSLPSIRATTGQTES